MLLLLLVLVSMLLIIFISLLGGLPVNTDPRWENWEHATGVFQNLATIIALGVGGWWTYHRLFVTRADFARLDLSVSGRLIPGGGGSYLAASFKVKNVGTVRVYIDRDASGVALSEFRADSAGDFTQITGEEKGGALGFERHEYIDPGEVVTNAVLFAVPKDNAGVIGVTLKVFSKEQGDQWFITSLVGPSAAGEASISSDAVAESS